jgi:hypothetical protein
MAPLARFAGVPEPLREAVAIASDAGLLEPKHGGVALAAAAPVDADVTVEPGRPLRLLVLTDAALEGSFAGRPIPRTEPSDGVAIVEIAPVLASTAKLALRGAVRAAWVVARSDEIEPPPPEPWDGGANPDELPP